MDRRTFNYSLKNIPIPSERSYLQKLIEKVEALIRRMRWKACFFESENDLEASVNNYGFKTKKCPPQVKDMIKFEEDMHELVKSVQFKRVKNEFLNKLKEDAREINQSSKLFVFADKSRNIYEVAKETHDKLLSDNTTKTYKKADESTRITVDAEAKAIASKLGIAERVHKMAEKNAFITLKDHKDNFENSPKCRLLNPAKSELGTVSKKITEKICTAIKDSTRLNQWQNTSSVIKWFCGIENKNAHTFVQFDIVDFYPSISKDLFHKAIEYARNFTNISSDELDILLHCKRSFLFGKNSTWVKKNGDQDFDVTMGSYDGAETCELVGLYILHLLSATFDTGNIGLYRDDGLAVLKNANGHEADKIRKETIRAFKNVGLDITIHVNLNIVDFLDVTLNLHDGTYKPYHKPNDSPMYINVNSNHPPSIIKQLPKSINKRINELSSNKDIFESSAKFYDDALKTSGYTERLSFIERNSAGRSRRNRSRKIIWFNPPYSVSVKSNIARSFLNLIGKHFPKSHRLHKIFNRNNIKVSYSCMPDFASQIKSHNAKISKPAVDTENISSCNCRRKDLCPLQGNCLVKSVVYRARITNENKPETNYVGLTENEFKGREREHNNSFINIKKEKSTELSKYMWNEKKNNEGRSKIAWSIIQQVPAYRNGDSGCRLCLAEKYHVIFQPFRKLNTRNEIVSKCRHENKFYLSNVPI